MVDALDGMISPVVVDFSDKVAKTTVSVGPYTVI